METTVKKKIEIVNEDRKKLLEQYVLNECDGYFFSYWLKKSLIEKLDECIYFGYSKYDLQTTYCRCDFEMKKLKYVIQVDFTILVGDSKYCVQKCMTHQITKPIQLDEFAGAIVDEYFRTVINIPFGYEE